MNFEFDLKTSNRSDFSLSFSVDLPNSTHEGLKREIKSEKSNDLTALPHNALFNISSIVFNLEKRTKEVLCNYSCFYQPAEKSFCIVIENEAKCSDFSKDVMMNLIDLAQKNNVITIFFLIDRKNPNYVKLLQSLMTIGCEQEAAKKTAVIEGKVYKILRMNIKSVPEEIEEIEF